MNKKVNIFKATAAFLIILAAVFYYFEEVKVPEISLNTVQVIIAITDIPENTVIEEKMLVVENRYKEDVMKTSNIAETLDEVVGKRSLVPLYKGETVNKNRVIENKSYMNTKDQTQIALSLNEIDKALVLNSDDYIDIWLEPISSVQDEVINEPHKIIEKIQIIKTHDSNYNNQTKQSDSINTASNAMYVPAYITIELSDEAIKGIFEVDKSKYNIRITRYGDEKLYNVISRIVREE